MTTQAIPAAEAPRVLNVALVPGDGIGPEVVEATLPLVAAAASSTSTEIQFAHLDWGGERYLRTGEATPTDAVDAIRRFDSVLFRAPFPLPFHVAGPAVWLLAPRQFF